MSKRPSSTHTQSFNDHIGWKFESSEMGRCWWASGFQILKYHCAFIFRVKGEHSTFTFRVKESWQQQKHWEHQISQYYKLLPYSACNTPLPRWSILPAMSASIFCLHTAYLCQSSLQRSYHLLTKLDEHKWMLLLHCSHMLLQFILLHDFLASRKTNHYLINIGTTSRKMKAGRHEQS
jgi:hypothetical protein